MTDRPILFSAPMVRALLEGRKHQTRRVLKPQPTIAADPVGEEYGYRNKYDYFIPAQGWTGHGYTIVQRLWVREAWRTESDCYDDLAPSEMSGEETILYDADADWSDNRSTGRSRRGFHMPRWASRLALEVTGVKVEKLNGLTPEDAIAEGIQCDDGSCDPVVTYAKLWDRLNAKRGFPWSSNPWICAVTFRVLNSAKFHK